MEGIYEVPKRASIRLSGFVLTNGADAAFVVVDDDVASRVVFDV